MARREAGGRELNLLRVSHFTHSLVAPLVRVPFVDRSAHTLAHVQCNAADPNKQPN